MSITPFVRAIRFLEAQPDPAKVKGDGPCALPLAELEPFLRTLVAVDAVVKG